MTVIAGMLNKEGCWLATDSQSTYGDTPITSRPGKSVSAGGVHVLFCGIPAVDVLSSALTATFAEKNRASIYDFCRFVNAFALEAGWNGEEVHGCLPERLVSMIVTDGWRLYAIDRQLIVHEFVKNEPWAQGSGADFSMGAYHVSKRTKTSAYQTLANMINAACQYDVHCGRPAKVWMARRSDAEWRFR